MSEPPDGTAPHEGSGLVACRCAVLNVMSGEVARDYVRQHLDRDRTDGMGRTLYRCPQEGVGWVEEREPGGYGQDVVVLRRDRR